MSTAAAPQDLSPCPGCGTDGLTPFLTLDPLPVNALHQYRSALEAREARRGDFVLVGCTRCGLIFNSAFDPAVMDYDEEYENSLHFSEVFSSFAEDAAADLIDRFGIRNKTVLEIGCGKGDFLELICEMGGNEGWGFDPSYEGEEGRRPDGRVTYVKEFYAEKHGSHGADLVLCRQVLEHIDHPVEFLSGIRRAIGRNHRAVVVFEVPNALDTLRRVSIWDVIYEHVTYLTPPSLRYLFERSGYLVTDLKETYGGIYLQVEALPVEPVAVRAVPSTDVGGLSGLVAGFADRVGAKLDFWNERLTAHAHAGESVVLWGAGSRGVTFLNLVGAGSTIERVVDVNPRKWGYHVAGTGQLIVSPESLRADPPRHVIITNPVYENEIAESLNKLGIHAEVSLA